MLFTEARFFVFFALVYAVYWTLARNGARKAWLLLASYVFYGAWDWRFLGLIAGSTALDYVVAKKMARTEALPRRRRLLLISLIGNLGSLALFKYFDFFVTSGTGLLQRLGLDLEPRVLGWILPVGISFYTFQSLSYTIDVYRRRLHPVDSPLDFALFVSFFPQLVAGPIVRASDFLPQLDEKKSFASVELRACLVLFLVGYVKKACLSDNLAPVVDQVFTDPGAYDALSLWIGALLYTIRIYCDFSGYSDMAIATAGLLGYRLALNFNHPYVAQSITDFWRRWHISLSTWFRDYLYIPLGGNRNGAAATYRNLLIVFFLCGLWHGANWTFVAWGLFHGLFLVIERLAKISPDAPSRFPPGRHLYVLITVVIGWVLFRAQTLGDAMTYLRGMIGHPVSSTSLLPPVDPGYIGVILLFATVHAWARDDRIARLAAKLPESLFSIGYGVAAALALAASASDYTAFIYFQF